MGVVPSRLRPTPSQLGARPSGNYAWDRVELGHPADSARNRDDAADVSAAAGGAVGFYLGVAGCDDVLDAGGGRGVFSTRGKRVS